MPRSLSSSFWALALLFACAAPAHADLKITTRSSLNGQHPTRHTVYFKDGRQRTEHQPEDAGIPWSDTTVVYQCDQKRLLQLSPRYRTYDYIPLDENGRPASSVEMIPMTKDNRGGDVTITIDSVDTGERKAVGSYTARRVKTAIRVESSPSACMHANLTESDGWYIDLPFDLSCRKQSKRAGFSYVAPAGCHDRLTIKRLGEADLGYPIEVTTTRTEAGQATIHKTELVEFSETALDAELFAVPDGYNAALHTPQGTDFTRTSSLKNRVGNYLAQMKSAMARLWP